MTGQLEQAAGMALAEMVKAAVTEAVEQTLADLVDRPLVHTVPQAAELLQVSSRLVERWVAEGILPRVPHTGRVLIPRRALEAFVDSAEHLEQLERAS